MVTLTAQDILRAFPKRDRPKIVLPDLGAVRWDALDYLGWKHPSGHKWYLVHCWRNEHRGVILESGNTGPRSSMQMCSLCMTVHNGQGVNLFTVKAKNRTIGEYICSDLSCGLYIRGILKSSACQMRECKVPVN